MRSIIEWFAEMAERIHELIAKQLVVLIDVANIAQPIVRCQWQSWHNIAPLLPDSDRHLLFASQLDGLFFNETL